MIETSDWYTSLIDDCKAIITEAVFNSRWELICGYHALGKRIVTEERLVWNERGNGKTLTDLSKFTGIGERDIYRAMQFYKKYPDVNQLSCGKNITWTKITSELLPAVPSGVASPAPAFEYARMKQWYTKASDLHERFSWPSDKAERFTKWHNAGKEFFE